MSDNPMYLALCLASLLSLAGGAKISSVGVAFNNRKQTQTGAVIAVAGGVGFVLLAIFFPH